MDRTKRDGGGIGRMEDERFNSTLGRGEAVAVGAVGATTGGGGGMRDLILNILDTFL